MFGRTTSRGKGLRRHAIIMMAAATVMLLSISAVFAVQTSADDSSDTDMVYPTYNPKPKGIPPVPIPADNPQTPTKVKLGEMLYFDPMLSSDGTISCASCHAPALGFGDGERVSDGVGGSQGGRNAPTVYNAVYYETQFWDGRALTLEEQAAGPVENPIEMANTWDNVVIYLKSDATYSKLFKKVFGGEITKDTATKAIASYERTVITWDSPYDRYVAGDEEAMTPTQVAGMDLFFGKASCGGCHAPPLFLESAFGNIGVPQVKDTTHFPNDGMDEMLAGYDLGRAYVTGLDEDMGRFKTPGLRNIELTAPYMHNGILETLEDVIAHYNMVPEPVVGALEEDLVTDLGLTEQEQAQLVEFLKALTGRTYSYVPEDTMPEMLIPLLNDLLTRPVD
ncbi:MAG TPA: cytochrome-c peroxidase [Thermoplasmata archaeon]